MPLPRRQLALACFCLAVTFSATARGSDGATPQAVRFAAKSAAVDDTVRQQLDRIFVHLQTNEALSVEIAATAPPVSDGGSRQLRYVAELRLEEAFDHLTRKGINPARIGLSIEDATRPKADLTVKFGDTSAGEELVPSPAAAPGTDRASLHFEHRATSVRGSDEAALLSVIAVLSNDAGARAKLEGFTDATGSVEQNLMLSRLRTLKITNRIVRAGIAPDRLEVIARGLQGSKDDPPQKREEYRRVDVTIEPSPASPSPAPEPEPKPTPSTPAPAAVVEEAPRGTDWTSSLGIGPAFPLGNLKDGLGRGLAARASLSRPLGQWPGIEAGGQVGITTFRKSTSSQSNELSQNSLLATAVYRHPIAESAGSPTWLFGLGLGANQWQAKAEDKVDDRKQSSSGKGFATEACAGLRQQMAPGTYLEARLLGHRALGDFDSQYSALTLGGALDF